MTLLIHHTQLEIIFSLIVRKPVFGVSRQVGHKQACAATDLAISDQVTREAAKLKKH